MANAFNEMAREAERLGLVVPGRAADLALFFAERGATMPESAADARGLTVEESEQPRFVRGFHDVLITIGILAVTIGAIGVGGPLAACGLAIALSEIFVKRQRLALPSVVLSVIVILSAAFLSPLLPIDAAHDVIGQGVLALLAAGFYHWRYKTPISLAGMVFAAGFLIFVSTIFVLHEVLTLETAAAMGDPSLLLVKLLLSLALFAVAMRYDLSDPRRVTRRSDTAFWLHLGAAPLCVHTATSFILGSRDIGAAVKDPMTAAIVIGTVFMLMIVGLVIDRRAFVTAGLLSLGVALSVIVREGFDTGLDGVFWISALVVGAVVLAIGLFWLPLRRFLLDLLPDALRRRLAPVQ